MQSTSEAAKRCDTFGGAATESAASGASEDQTAAQLPFSRQIVLCVVRLCALPL